MICLSVIPKSINQSINSLCYKMTSKVFNTGNTVAIISSPKTSGSQGELIVYPCSGVHHRPSVVRRRQQCSNIFSSETAWPIKAKFHVEPPHEGGGESFYKKSRSHDQDGRHDHIWLKPLKIFFSRTYDLET